MPNCRVCGKPVTSGYVVCSDECIKPVSTSEIHKTLTAIIYYLPDTKATHTTAQASNSSERDVIDKFINNPLIESIYFIETKKLIEL
jgi:hypothetical protein